MQALTIFNFSHYSDPEFLAKAGHIRGSLIGNAHFPPPWSVQMPTIEQIDMAFDDYHAACDAAFNQGTFNISPHNSEHG
jgi:hypothetical protein